MLTAASVIDDDATTSFSAQRTAFVVQGPSQHPLIQPQQTFGSDLAITWTDGTPTASQHGECQCSYSVRAAAASPR
jgi:hypothetical protein